MKRVPLPAEPGRDPFVNNTHTLLLFIEYRRLAYGAHYATGHSQVTCHVGNDRWQFYRDFKHRSAYCCQRHTNVTKCFEKLRRGTLHPVGDIAHSEKLTD